MGGRDTGALQCIWASDDYQARLPAAPRLTASKWTPPHVRSSSRISSCGSWSATRLGRTAWPRLLAFDGAIDPVMEYLYASAIWLQELGRRG
jgi:hypothetical protein